MGCDIHFYVETWDGTRWQSADKWTKSYDRCAEDVNWQDSYYDDRSYDLFAILAGVRNRAGLKPIAPPRGLPANVDPRIKAASDDWAGDGHSHSWLTVSEIISYDWTQRHLNEMGGDIPYYRLAQEFWRDTMPRLLALGKPEHVRIVFFFDN